MCETFIFVVTAGLLLKGGVVILHFSLQPWTRQETLQTKLAQAQHRAKGFWFCVQSVSSSFCDRAQMQDLCREIFKVVRPACLDGTPWCQEVQVVFPP